MTRPPDLFAKPAVRAVAAIALLAILLRLAFGPGGIGYDASWAITWGRELADGDLPDFEAPGAPTPHPLQIAVAAVLAPLGAGAIPAVLALSWLSLAGLGYAAYLLGRELFSPWVGVAFAVILVTRGLLVRETHEAVVDVPFLALVVAAIVVEVQRPREGLRVPILLCLAGLLRPEAWLLGAAWLAYAARGTPRDDVLRQAAVVAIAPLVWVLGDLVVTGNPLHSLRGTQELAEALGRPRGLDTAFTTAPDYLRATLGVPVIWLGLAGTAVGLAWRRERAALPLALLVLGLLGFLFLGIADLSLIIRYLLVPASMLALFAALLAFGWTAVPARGPSRTRWLVVGVVGMVVLAVYVPREVDRLADQRADRVRRVAIHADLERLVDQPAVRAAAARCEDVWLPSGRGRALELSLWLDRPLASIPSRAEATPGAPGLYLVYATPRVARAANPRGPLPAGERAVPAGAREVARTGTWLAAERC
jgi:4-amino-4-deoxy-L-arabinose transferase-like glycosyltransferase